jgi:tRNA 2-thiocytidine biosynthesis protein TtcA
MPEEARAWLKPGHRKDQTAPPFSCPPYPRHDTEERKEAPINISSSSKREAPQGDEKAAKKARTAAEEEAEAATTTTTTTTTAAAPPAAPSSRALADVHKKISRLVSKASLEFKMLRDGDRVLVGLSGGKDSLTMLNILLDLKRKLPFKLEIGACTIDPQADGFDPSPLKAYLAKLGVPYFYESEAIIDLAGTCMKNDSICSFCARMKRGKLYGAARREGYNVLALGQHADDLCESFVMSAFYNGKLKTMKAHYVIDEGDLRVIRPLSFVRERLTREYADLAGLPIINENCPACYEEPKVRRHTKSMLATEEQGNQHLFDTLMRTIRPLMERDLVEPTPEEKSKANKKAADNFDD